MERADFTAFGRPAAIGLIGLSLCGPMASSATSQTRPTGWSVGPEPLVSIGVVDGAAPYLFDGVTAVRLLPDGRIVVGDAGSATVRVYDQAGVFQRQMGRSGQGPGEFGYITSIWVAKPDTLLVYDRRNLRLSRLLVSGELLGSVTLRPDGGPPETYLGRLGDGTHLIRWLRAGGQMSEEPLADSVLVGRFEGDSLHSVVSVSAGMRRIYVQGNPGYSGPLPFSPHPLGALIGDTLFRSDGLAGLVEAVDAEGWAVRSFTVPVPAWSVRDAEARLAPHLDKEYASHSPRLSSVQGVTEVPTLSDMLADSESLLWVKAYDPATDSHATWRPRTGGEWWVLRTDGKVVARVGMPEGFRPMEVTRDRVAGVTLDALGVERVAVFALRRRE